MAGLTKSAATGLPIVRLGSIITAEDVRAADDDQEGIADAVELRPTGLQGFLAIPQKLGTSAVSVS
jgi:hypothetical protein